MDLVPHVRFPLCVHRSSPRNLGAPNPFTSSLSLPRTFSSHNTTQHTRTTRAKLRHHTTPAPRLCYFVLRTSYLITPRFPATMSPPTTKPLIYLGQV